MKSFISYLGGKSLLTKKIIPLIPKHHCYCEVFAGAAWLLFRKEPSKVEIINDINTDLVNLYRVVKNHLEEFVRYLKWVLVARDQFDLFKKENSETLTDIQRAVRFYYLLKTGYASKVDDPYFAISTHRRSAFNLLRIEEELSAAHLRLSMVFIENKPYQNFIQRFDKPDTFFYLDPPYYNCEDYYGKGIFSKDDFNILAGLLKDVSGKFILSINDVPEIRKLFKEFNFTKVTTRYSSNAKARKNSVQELLIMNY